MSEQAPEPHRQARCNGCREWIDARAASCYLCGEERVERNAALVNAVHADRVNGHLYGEGNASRRDHAATRSIPSGNLNGRAGPSGAAYRGARGYDSLVKSIKSSLREAGLGE